MFLGKVDKRNEPRHLGPCVAAGMAVDDHEVVMRIASEQGDRVEAHATGEPEIDELLALYASGLGIGVLP